MGRGHLAFAVLFAAAALAPAVAADASAHDGRDLSWTMLVQGSRLGSADRDDAFLVRSRVGANPFRRLLEPEDAARVRAVDFSRFAAVAIVAAFPSCGWSLDVRRVQQQDAVVRILLTVHSPLKDTLVCQAETRAYAVLRVPRAQLRGVTRALPYRVR